MNMRRMLLIVIPALFVLTNAVSFLFFKAGEPFSRAII